MLVVDIERVRDNCSVVDVLPEGVQDIEFDVDCRCEMVRVKDAERLRVVLVLIDQDPDEDTDRVRDDSLMLKNKGERVSDTAVVTLLLTVLEHDKTNVELPPLRLRDVLVVRSIVITVKLNEVRVVDNPDVDETLNDRDDGIEGLVVVVLLTERLLLGVGGGVTVALRLGDPLVLTEDVVVELALPVGV